VLRIAQEEKAQEADLNWKRTEKEMGTQLVETKVRSAISLESLLPLPRA
jgi:hypothetical protein